MRETEKLEKIFDRYVGLELLNRDWNHAPAAAGRSGRSAEDHARAATGETSRQFREEPVLQGVAGGT